MPAERGGFYLYEGEREKIVIEKEKSGKRGGFYLGLKLTEFMNCIQAK